jgi:hypothetical protein
MRVLTFTSVDVPPEAHIDAKPADYYNALLHPGDVRGESIESKVGYIFVGLRLQTRTRAFDEKTISAR